jgi:hypothetical protein
MTPVLIAALLMADAQEWIGAELSPLSVASARVTDLRMPAPFHLDAALQPGLRIRLLRHRWTRFYWTPIAATLVLPVAQETGSLVLAGGTEGGVALHALEVGLAVDGGLMFTWQPGSCDGYCSITGTGVIPSAVVRWYFDETLPLTAAIFARLIVPLVPRANGNALDRQFYSVLLAGIDLGYGRR